MLFEEFPNQLIYKPQTGLKAAAFEMWTVGGVVFNGSIWTIGAFTGSVFWAYPAAVFAPIFANSICAISIVAFFIWLFVKPTTSTFDRSSQTVRFRSHKLDFTLSWNQIHFRTINFPTKAGNSTEFFVKAFPPFPEALQLILGVKSKGKFQGIDSINLGSFRVKNDEEAARYVEFFNAYMSSNNSAEEIFQNVVRVPPSEVPPFKDLEI